MEKDLARDIAKRRGEIAAIDPGDDPARILIKQSLAGALYAVWMAARHDYPDLARARAADDAERERALAGALVGAVADECDDPSGRWAADFFFGSALLRTAAAVHATLRHRYLALMGAGFCRSRTRLEEQASRDGVITEADRQLLACIREEADRYGQERERGGGRAAASVNDLLVALGLLAGMVQESSSRPRAGKARG